MRFNFGDLEIELNGSSVKDYGSSQPCQVLDLNMKLRSQKGLSCQQYSNIRFRYTIINYQDPKNEVLHFFIPGVQ